MKKIVVVVLATLIMAGCNSPEQQARDTAAGLSGVLTTAQSQFTASCQADSNQNVCQIINRGIAGQNALITATETYCGFALTPTPPDPSEVCHPVKTAQPALQTAITNANQLITEIKGVIK